MTAWLDGAELARGIEEAVPGSVESSDATAVWVRPERLHDVAARLKQAEAWDFEYLNAITAVDYVEYFEVLYHLTSMRINQACVIKVKCWGRDEPSLPSVVDLWQGADLQEREIYDLMGVVFTGHPSLRRILLWEGYVGHPLRRDYLEEPLPYSWPHGG
jgi:NADH-quinone oxidoreductase subunit C